MFGRIKNLDARNSWLRQTLAAIPAGRTILDVGAGECPNKKDCSHLSYKAQDIAQYDGAGNKHGLHTGEFDFHQLDFVCDLYDIPEDELFDCVMCTEVLEHVVDPVRAIQKLTRMVKPGGTLIITAPFCSWTHFAPYHYATGFSEYFYNKHIESEGFEIVTMEANGGYFDLMDQEMGRIGSVRRRYSGIPLDPLSFVCLWAARMSIRLLAAMDGPRNQRKSSELATFGWHVKAVRRAA
jgi:SAM-dependent methyltransferase